MGQRPNWVQGPVLALLFALGALSTAAQGAARPHPLSTFAFKDWEVLAPSGWADRSESEDTNYLESGDHSKGLYCTVLSVRHFTSETYDDVIQKMQAAGALGRGSMAGFQWKKLAEHRSQVGDQCRYEDDYCDQVHKYRIRTIVLITPRRVLRAAFHDYYFIDLKESNAAFRPLLTSLRFR